MTDAPRTNCLHCKLSFTVLDHLREQQGLTADQKPRFQALQIKEVFDALISVTADVIVPRSGTDPEELLERLLAHFNAKLTATCLHRLKCPDEGTETIVRVH